MPAKGTKMNPAARAAISAARRIPQATCTCKNCGVVFHTHQSEVARGGGVYCSRKCEGEWKTGRLMSPESNRKKSIAFTGRVFTPEWKANLSAAKRRQKRN